MKRMGRLRKATVVLVVLFAGTTMTSAETTLRGSYVNQQSGEMEHAGVTLDSSHQHNFESSTDAIDVSRRLTENIHHRREQQVLAIPSSFSQLDQNLVSLSILSAKIAACVNKDDPTSVLECSNALSFVSTWSPDKAIVVHAQQHGICFGAFQATKPIREDWAQNFDPGIAEDVCSPYNGLCCPSRKGFNDAYRNVSYLVEFEEALEDCKLKCSGGDCDVILTGFSQGGSVATVGAVYLNPTAVFTYGQPPTCEEPCYAFDAQRIYRFVNTKVVNGDLRYDLVPFLSFGAVDHMGNLFVVGEDTKNVAYYKDSAAPKISFNHWSYSSVLQVHSMESYITRLESFQNFPVGLDGFAVGEDCSSLDSECEWPHICSQGKCSTGENGSACNDEDDCLSGRCDGMFGKRCMPKLPQGESCNEHSDCISGSCVWWACGP